MSVTSRPRWVRDALFYQIFPDRFARSSRVPKPSRLEDWHAPPTAHGYKGGDLLGIVEHLDWLEELRIDGIYLNPVFHSASNHRYHTYDYYAVDPMLGGNDALTELLDACHRRSMRVVLDGVFNHGSRGFFPFHDVLENGAASPYAEWFHLRHFPLCPYDESQPPGYDAWWGLAALPKLNTDHPEVREYLMRVGEHWARAGIDGWRLDVPNEIETPGFWEEFRERVRAIRADLYLVGEIWDEASEWIGDGRRFDGVMNYRLGSAIIAFAVGDRVDLDQRVDNPAYAVAPPLDGAGYQERIEDLLRCYPAEATRCNLNLLDSHDTARILTLASGDEDAVALSLVLLLTLPGAPCLYYGTEIGLAGGRDPDCRRAFPWDRQAAWSAVLPRAVRELSRLRHEHRALRSTDYRSLWPGEAAASGTGAYACARGSGDESLVVAVNPGPATERLRVPPVTASPPAARWRWGSVQIAPHDDGVELTMPPRSAVVCGG